ncbi:CxC2 domain-containing protein [Mycena indigotica]|uniref:CxC2 domain-containing protein n=1 Tax=Mycena indigotica TaxID=2126181 RepID=A0A8H6W388_9AGAR|nr:CxC2 domain-containing protein [Mycena indigotica]KAF7303362.1 CxC2 domain-containing protein [Mycena indigotica]
MTTAIERHKHGLFTFATTSPLLLTVNCGQNAHNQTKGSPRKRSATHQQESFLLPTIPLESATIMRMLEAGDDPWAEGGFQFDEGHPQEKLPSRPTDLLPFGMSVTSQPIWTSHCAWRVFQAHPAIYVNRQMPPSAVEIASWTVYSANNAYYTIIKTYRSIAPRYAFLLLLLIELLTHWHKLWNGSFFELKPLKQLGLRIQLGHPPGQKCPGTLARGTLGGPPQHDDFCIIDCNGIHEVALDICTCPSAPERATQLLRARLFPATSTRPRTAASFQVLRLFHLVSFEAKCSPFEFYNALARLTNNNGTFQPRDRYREFVTMTREWRFIQMVKRAGQGHETGGCRNIPAGACALLCPACPQPGKNLPADGSWKNGPPHERFRYSLFLAIDANFKMKRKQVSSEGVDPGLNQGSAFFSDVSTYMDHVRKHWGLEQEKSTCVSHDAVNEPDRESRGTASSGIGTVDCARHNMKRPNAVGDLQKGERYINMDYMLWKSLNPAQYNDLVDIIVSYDIACQWSKNVWLRIAKYDDPLRDAALRNPTRRFVFLIPKFHLPAHIERCNVDYSFDLTPNVGRTDGEAPERGWANANPLASSTREMGPGARRDTIDDHFNDWNHKKILGIGKSLLEKMKTAITEMVETRMELAELEAVLPMGVVQSWHEAMEKWEEDATQPNPFSVTSKVESVQDIRARLKDPSPSAFYEAPPAFNTLDDIHDDLHAADLIAMALTLEEQRHTLASDAAELGIHATTIQKASISEREAKLQRKFVSWFDIQINFAPEVAAVRAGDDSRLANSGDVETTRGSTLYDMQLLLPSSLISRSGVLVRPSHAWYEFQLRKGRALHLLEELRRLLLVRTQKYKAKDKHASGVAGHTRAGKAIQAIDGRIRHIAEDYRRTRTALLSLTEVVGNTTWKAVLKDLKQADVRAMPRALFADPDHRKRKRGDDDTPKEMSWIWRMGIGSVPVEVAVDSLSAAAASSAEAAVAATNEGLRVEWAKTRARAKRWAEEVELLQEEMRRVLVFCSWRAGWWKERRNRREGQGLDSAITSGLRAYADRQAHIQVALRTQFEGNWRDIPTFLELGLKQVKQIHIDAQSQLEGMLSMTVDDDAAFQAVPERPDQN